MADESLYRELEDLRGAFEELTERLVDANRELARVRTRLQHAVHGAGLSLGFAAIVILARLLTPAELGLFAIAFSITRMAALFERSSLSRAATGGADMTQAQASTFFWIDVAFGALSLLAIACAALGTVRLYEEPRLLTVTLALGVTVLFDSLTLQHRTLMRQNNELESLATIEILAMIAGLSTAIVTALSGLGYWSLVSMIAVVAAARAVLSFVLSGWTPGAPARGSGVRRLLRFPPSIDSLLGRLNRAAEVLVVGYVFGERALGLYLGAILFLGVPWLRPLHVALNRRLLGRRSESGHFRKILECYLGLTAALSFTIALLLAFNAESLIGFFLGDTWIDSAPVLAALAPAALVAGMRPILSFPGSPPRLSFSVGSSVFATGALIAGSGFGFVEMAVAVSASRLALFAVEIQLGLLGSALSRREVWTSLLPAGLAGVVSSLVFALFAPASGILASLLLTFSLLLVTALLQRFLRIPSIFEVFGDRDAVPAR